MGTLFTSKLTKEQQERAMVLAETDTTWDIVIHAMKRCVSVSNFYTTTGGSWLSLYLLTTNEIQFKPSKELYPIAKSEITQLTKKAEHLRSIIENSTSRSYHKLTRQVNETLSLLEHCNIS